MRRYEEYKSCDPDWINPIPTNWNLFRIKSVISRTINGVWGNEPEENNTDIVCIRVADFLYDSLSVSESNLTYRNISIDQLNGRILERGDLIIEKSGGGDKQPVGRVVKFDLPLKAVTSNFISRIILVRGTIVPDFLLYYFSSLYANRVNTRSIKQTTGIQNLDFYSYSTELMPVPSTVEQICIGRYLDQKTQLIDTLIKKRKKQIELLKEQRITVINQAVTRGLDQTVKMKHSRIEWLGELPKHWEITKVKFLSNIISKGTTPSTIGREVSDAGAVRFLKAENILNYGVTPTPEFYIDHETDEVLKRSRLCKNDILFVIAGATIGKVAVLPLDLLPANTNQAVCFIRLSRPSDSKYLWYWLQSSKIQENIWLEAVQSAQPNIAMEDLGNLPVPFPAQVERERIVDFLNLQTSKIADLIEKEEGLIEKLQEYRTTLISNVVTGKIDVREEVIPNGTTGATH